MVSLSVAILFLAVLSCASAPAPAPSPLQHSTPTPVQHSAPAPVKLSAPAPSPEQHSAPAPVKQHSAPAPVKLLAPAPSPVQQSAPAPVKLSAPAPAPVQHSAPAPVKHSAPAPSPVQQSPPVPSPEVYGGSPESSPEIAPSPMDPCFNALLNMSDCLTYVTAGSNLTTPDKGCCPELAGLVEGNPVCLCKLFAGSASYGIDLDMAKALKLPSVCKVTTPPLSTCSLLGIPVGAPASSLMVPEMSPSGPPPTTVLSPESSSFRISVPVFLMGLWGGIATIF